MTYNLTIRKHTPFSLQTHTNIPFDEAASIMTSVFAEEKSVGQQAAIFERWKERLKKYPCGNLNGVSWFLDELKIAPTVKDVLLVEDLLPESPLTAIEAGENEGMAV